MGKKTTKKRKTQKRFFQSKTVQGVALLVLVLACVAGLIGMSALNRSAKPNRDMQWYVRDGAVQIAAPASGSAYTTTDYTTADGKAGGAVVLPEATEAATAVPTRRPNPTAQTPTAQPTPSPVPIIDPVSITITAAGDCTLGGTAGAGYNRFQDMVSKKGYDYFLENFRPLFESDDLTIVNLEGPLTTSMDKRAGRPFNFKGDPANAAILSGSSVEICNVANNHILDYGRSGLQQTAEVLTAAGIGWSGYGKAYSTEINGVRVTSLGFTEWDFESVDIASAVAEARAGCDLLIVSMHWGDELDYTASSEQQRLGRAIVDAGADLVLGTHPHVVQGVELYKGKYIVYSLGNFCFGGNSNPSDKRCLVFQQTFTFTTAGGLADAGINLIPASVSSSSGRNDFQPLVLSAEKGEKVLKLVAKDSRGLSLANTLWMPGNYMAENGLMTLDAGDAGAEAEADEAAGAEAEAAPEAVSADPDHEPTWEEKLSRGT